MIYLKKIRTVVLLIHDTCALHELQLMEKDTFAEF